MTVYLYVLCLDTASSASELGLTLRPGQPFYIGITSDSDPERRRPEHHIKKGKSLRGTVRWSCETHWPGRLEAGWFEEHVRIERHPYRWADAARLKRLERYLINRWQPPLNREWRGNPLAATSRPSKKALRSQRKLREARGAPNCHASIRS